MSAGDMDDRIAEGHAQHSEVGDRIAALSEAFLGTPYALGNLGEGDAPDERDRDPRFNVGSVDCTTFVEHVLAFARATNVGAARAQLDAIRYTRAVVGYATRRHFPEAQWVPGLIAEGFLQDVTASLAEDAPVQLAIIEMDSGAYARSAHAASMLLRASEVPVGRFALPYAPLHFAEKLAPRLRNGLVINIVRAPRNDLLVRVSHQGLIIVRGDKIFVRHATTLPPRAVVDEPWHDFVARHRAMKRWSVVGFNLLRARE